MKKLGEILHSLSQWIKGRAYLLERPDSMCLGYALCLRLGGTWGDGWSRDSYKGWTDRRMNRIVTRLFPERITGNPFQSPLVVFNNHPETTWEDVQKVIQLYDQEVEDGVPIEGYC